MKFVVVGVPDLASASAEIHSAPPTGGKASLIWIFVDERRLLIGHRAADRKQQQSRQGKTHERGHSRHAMSYAEDEKKVPACWIPRQSPLTPEVGQNRIAE